MDFFAFQPFSTLQVSKKRLVLVTKPNKNKLPKIFFKSSINYGNHLRFFYCMYLLLKMFFNIYFNEFMIYCKMEIKAINIFGFAVSCSCQLLCHAFSHSGFMNYEIENCMIIKFYIFFHFIILFCSKTMKNQRFH